MDDIIYKIKDYSEIFIKKNSLIVLDIDDTILTYRGISDKFYNDKFNYYHKMYHDYDMIYKLIRNDWNEFIKSNPPYLINQETFFNFTDIAVKNKCEIIFLTSRPQTMKLITRFHFEHNGLSDFLDKIHYSPTKGKYLKELVFQNFKSYHKIILVDDLKSNLMDIYYSLNKFKDIDLYLFQF